MSYIGLSFPIKLGSRGGFKMSSTANITSDRMGEIITLILSTGKYERLMHPELGSDTDIHLYENDDMSIRSLLQYEISTALNKDPRIQCNPNDITLTEESDIIYVDVLCTVEGDKKSYKVPMTGGK